MSILPANGNELAWFGFSARSRGQATAITIAHRDETFSRNPAADVIGRSGSNEHGPDLRRKGSRTVRKIGVGVRREAVPEQNQACAGQRCGRGAAEQAHVRIYGCYDWHSSVHGHWLLVRLLRTFPNASFAAQARDALRKSLTAENLKQEAAYLRGEGRVSFERPYGLAWLLQLCAELREWDDGQAREMAANLRPLEDAAVERLKTWLPKLSHPVRIGEHDQTAFVLGLMFVYDRSTKNDSLARLAAGSAKKFFFSDKDCPLDYER